MFFAKNLGRLMTVKGRRVIPISVRCFGKEIVQCPEMGDSISEGTVEEFEKKIGQWVNADDVVARVETDKIVVDITSPHSGVLTEVLTEEGETIEVEGEFFVIDTDAEKPAEEEAPKEEAPAEAEPVKEEAPKEAPAAEKPKPVPRKAPAEKPDFGSVPSGTRGETRVKMSRMRLRIAQRLKEA